MKRIFILLLALALLMSGCSFSLKSDVPENADRYFLYAADGKVHCLDTKNGKTEEITIPTVQAGGVGCAIVSDSEKIMVFELYPDGSEEYGLCYWDGETGRAEMVDPDANLVRINRKMDFFLYFKYTDKYFDLYQYDAKKGKQMIAADVEEVSMTDDGSSILYVCMNSDGTGGELFRKKRNGSAERISEVLAGSTNATSDHQVICYLKGESEQVAGGLCNAYMWTPFEGEKQLPFKATDIKVFSKNEIYYTVSRDDGASCYYYDGKTSKLLSGASSAHGHKLGDAYSYSVQNGEDKESYLVSGGKQISMGGHICSKMSSLGALSMDGKTVYTWNGSTMYRTTVGINGKLTTEKYLDTKREYSHRVMTMSGDHLLNTVDEISLDGCPIDGAGGGTLSQSGLTVAYGVDGDIYLYQNGKSFYICSVIVDDISDGYPTATSRVLLQRENGDLLLADENGTELIVAGCGEFSAAYPWSINNMGNIVLDGYITGMWYTYSGSDTIVY